MAGATTIGDLVFFLRGRDQGFTKMLDGARKKAEGFGRGMQSTGRAISGVGTKMAIAGGLISGALALAIKRGADFEQSITNAASVTGKTGKEFEIARDKMASLAKTLGQTTVFSASQAAEAMYDLASKGFDVANMSLEELEPMLNLAAATQDDLSHATKTVTGTLKAYNMENTETTRIADVFAKAVGSSAATMDKLSNSMAYVAPIASAAGVKFEEITAIMGKLYDANIDGSTAGTAMRRMIAELISPSEKLKGVLKRLTLTTKDVDLKTHSLTEIMEVLKKRGFTTADAMQVFGQRAGPSVITLAGLGREGNKSIEMLKELNEKLNNAGGTAKTVADTQLNTLTGRMKLFFSATEGVVLQIAGALIPRLTALAEYGAKLAQSIGKWVDKNQVLFNTIIKVVAGVGTFLAVGGVFLIFVGTLIATIGGLIITGSAIVGFITTVGLPAIAAIGLAIMALMAPLIAIGAVIAASVTDWIEKMGGMEVAIGLITAYIKDQIIILAAKARAIWEELKPKLLAAWAWLKETAYSFAALAYDVLMNRVLPVILQAYEIGKAAALSIYNFVTDIVKRIWGTISQWIEANREDFRTFAEGVMSVLIPLWERISEAVLNAVTMIRKYWGEIQPYIISHLEHLVGFVFFAVEKVMKLINLFWPQIRKVSMFYLNNFLAVVHLVWNTISSAFKVFLQIVNGDFSGAWKTLMKFFFTNIGIILGRIGAVIPLILSLLGGLYAKAWMLLFSFWKMVLGWGVGAIKKVWSWLMIIPDMVGDALSLITDLWTSLPDRLRDARDTIMSAVAYPFKAAYAIIIKGLNFVIAQLNKVKITIPDWLNKLPGVDFGGKSFGFDIPLLKVPEFARGGRMPYPGLAMVGERGRELVALNRGAQVISNRDTEKAMGGRTVTLDINIDNMNIRDERDIREVAANLKLLIDDELRGAGLGSVTW